MLESVDDDLRERESGSSRMNNVRVARRDGDGDGDKMGVTLIVPPSTLHIMNHSTTQLINNALYNVSLRSAWHLA